MEELRWWSRILVVSAIVAVVLLVAGPLGYKFGLSPLQPSLVSLLIALFTGAVVVLLAFIMTIVSQVKALPRNRNLTVVALLVGAIPIVVMVPQMMAAQSVPPIHDITTDTVDPPRFFEVVALRADAPNDLEYGMENIPPEEMAKMQQAAYPEVRTLATELDVASAVARAADLMASQGHEVVNVDAAAGIVEGTATTFWFGFKDDMVVRVRPGDDGGSIVDMRSVSRVGQSDVGANAARIVAFLEAF